MRRQHASICEETPPARSQTLSTVGQPAREHGSVARGMTACNRETIKLGNETLVAAAEARHFAGSGKAKHRPCRKSSSRKELRRGHVRAELESAAKAAGGSCVRAEALLMRRSYA